MKVSLAIVTISTLLLSLVPEVLTRFTPDSPVECTLTPTTLRLQSSAAQ
jgi:hypothetical protein